MSRALQINTTVEYPSRYDQINIETAQKNIDKLKLIALEQNPVSEALAAEIKNAEENIAAEIADQITWIIGILPSSIYKAATKIKVSPVTADTKSFEVITAADEILTNLILVGLKGYKNFKNADDTPVEFRTVKGNIGGIQLDILDPELLNLIPWEHQVDIGNQVRLKNSVQAANLKN